MWLNRYAQTEQSTEGPSATSPWGSQILNRLYLIFVKAAWFLNNKYYNTVMLMQFMLKFMITSVFNVEQNMVNVSPWRHRIICNILRPQHTRRRFQHQRALHLVQRSKPQQLSRNPYYFLSDIPLTSSTRHVSTAWVVNIATPTTSYPTSRSQVQQEHGFYMHGW